MADQRIASLILLWNTTQQHTGTSGARVATGILLGLYNGDRFPFDLTELRALDRTHLAAALDVIGGDARSCPMEVHRMLDCMTGRTDFGERFEHLAHGYARFKRGRCKREQLRPVSPARLVLQMPQPEGEPA